MLEKFSDYEGSAFIDHAGTFVFEITSYDIRTAKSGNDMAVFSVMSNEGGMTIYHSLDKKARWSYNKLIKACLHLSAEDAKIYELDYETIGNELVGKKFVGIVEAESYTKITKAPQEDGTFKEEETLATSYKIKRYEDTADHPELVFPDNN